MEENFTDVQLKLLFRSLVSIGKLYVEAYDAVYRGAKMGAKKARAKNDKNEENRCYKRFREQTGLSVRDYSKLKKLLSTVSSF